MSNKYEHYDSWELIESELVKITDPIQLAITKSKVGKKIDSKMRQGYGKKEQAITYQLAKDSYLFLLEHIPRIDEKSKLVHVTAKDALMYAAEINKADIEQVLSEKSKNAGKLSGSLIKDHDEHSVQKDMIKGNVFDRQALKNSNNLWQLLRTLSTFKYLYEEIKLLKQSIHNMENRQDNIETELATAKSDIHKLKEQTGMPEMTDKERVAVLKELGYSQKLIARVVGKSLITIKRWWNSD